MPVALSATLRGVGSDSSVCRSCTSSYADSRSRDSFSVSSTGFGRCRRIGFTGVGHDAQRARAEVELGEHQEIVRQRRADAFGELGEDLAHVERFGDRAGQRLDLRQALAPPALGVPDPPVLDGGAEERRDRAQQFLVLGGEGVRLESARPDAAGELLAHPEGLPHRRAHSGADQHRVERELGVELLDRVVDPRDRTRTGTQARRPRGQRFGFGTVRIGVFAARQGRGVEHRPLPVEDAHDADRVERNDPANRSRDALEDGLQLERLRGDVGDFGEYGGQGCGVNGGRCLRRRIDRDFHRGRVTPGR